MSAWAESLLLWGLLAVLLFWFVGAHNRLVRLRSAAVQAFGALDALIVRQIDYVNSVGPAAPAGSSASGDGGEASGQPAAAEAGTTAAPDVEAPRGDAVPAAPAAPAAPDPAYVQNLVSLRAATAQLAAVLGATRPRPLDPSAMAALATALHVMLAAWARLHPGELVAFASDGTLARGGQAVAGQPDQVVAVEGDAPSALAAAPAALGWPEPTALIEMTRAQFNQAVQQYNAAISQFPAVLMAWVFGWRAGGPLV